MIKENVTFSVLLSSRLSMDDRTRKKMLLFSKTIKIFLSESLRMVVFLQFLWEMGY